MNIKEFAKVAGVSVSTVSKIMNNKDESISEETRTKVLNLAKEYNYRAYATIDNTDRRTFCLGVINDDSKECRCFINGLVSTAGSLGYSVMLRECGYDKNEVNKQLLVLTGAKIDGIVCMDSLCDESIRSLLEEREIPFSFIFNETASNSISYKKLGYIAAKALMAKGHRNVACYCEDSVCSKHFAEGYKECLFECGLSFDEALIIISDMGLALEKATGRMFTGIIFSDFISASEFYEKIQSHHILTPHEVSIITLKSESLAAVKYPQISSIVIPEYSYGAHVAEDLIARIEKRNSTDYECVYELDNNLSIDAPISKRCKRVISVGSVNIDNYLNVNMLPTSGRAVSTSRLSVFPGGKCLNEAIGVSKLGHNVAIIGSVGDDPDADKVYETLKNYNVDITYLKRCRGVRTGQAYIFVQRDGESTISIMTGANDELNKNDVTSAEPLFRDGGCCLLQTEVKMDTIVEAAIMAKKNNMTTVLKPSTVSHIPDELLFATDIIVPNLEELNEICEGQGPFDEKAKKLLDKGVKTVIVTLGNKGCYVKCKEWSESIPAIDVISIDNTGAGDAFISALVSYLVYGYDLLSAARIATFAAGLSTTREGVTPALVDKSTLEHYILTKQPDLLENG